jgi:hypothetical protein
VTVYAAEARAYALLALLVLALFLLGARRPETFRRQLAVAALAAAALYTHYLALFAVGALALFAVATRRWRTGAALAAGAAAFAPWFPVLAGQPREATAWIRESASASLASFFSALGGVGRVPAPFGSPAPRALFFAAAAAGVLLLAASATASRRDREIGAALFLVAAVLAGALLVDRWRPVAFAGRTEMAVLPVWLWAVARASVHSRAARWGAIAAASFGIAGTITVLRAGEPASATFSDVAAAVSGVARSADRVVAAGGFYLPLRLEAERGRLAASLEALPAELAGHPGWFVPQLPGERESRAVARAAGSLAPGARLFLVLPPAYATPGLLAALETPGGRVRAISRGRDALVILRTREAPSPQALSAP